MKASAKKKRETTKTQYERLASRYWPDDPSGPEKLECLCRICNEAVAAGLRETQRTDHRTAAGMRKSVEAFAATLNLETAWRGNWPAFTLKLEVPIKLCP